MRHGLGQVVVGAIFHGLFHIVGRRNSGEHNDWKIDILIADFLESRDPVLARHHDVQNHEGRVTAPGKRLQYLLSVLCKVNDAIGSTQRELKVIANLWFVFRYQNTERLRKMIGGVHIRCVHTAISERWESLKERTSGKTNERED